ncbi:MAG: sugar kinase, partial [Spirochaetaceae bacterium]|nr:sugar kinase [Spirochaetaceae bacterium]
AKKNFGPSELASVVGKWSSRELLFAVREPFPSKTTGTNMVFGKITPGETLRIESLMGENGVIFSDGIESDFIAFNSGTEARITIAEKKGRMVV